MKNLSLLLYIINLMTLESIRLGYACINTCIHTSKENLVNSSCVAKTFRDKGPECAIRLAKSNLTNVIKTLQWNEDNGIRFYRMSSDMFPHITNPEFICADGLAYDLNIFSEYFDRIGELAHDLNHRLTFHPSQYNQIGTPTTSVFSKTRLDLLVHASILDKCKLNNDSVMVVHGGGKYGDKNVTLDRWVEQFHTLDYCIKNRIVIENCERIYNYKDMLWLSKKIKRPLVFDTHHHSCYSEIIEELPDPKTFIKDVIKTWGTIRPKFHISEQAPDKRIGAHSDFVKIIPNYLLSLDQEIDIMIEAKKKEQAVLYLAGKYFNETEKNEKLYWIKLQK